MKLLTASFLQKASNVHRHCNCNHAPEEDCQCKSRFAQAWDIVHETGCTFKEALAQVDK